jgi:hypothetical protein
MAPSARKTGRSRSPRRRNGTPPRWPTARQVGWICAAAQGIEVKDRGQAPAEPGGQVQTATGKTLCGKALWVRPSVRPHAEMSKSSAPISMHETEYSLTLSRPCGRSPCGLSHRTSRKSDRCSYVCQGGRMTFGLPHFWGLRVVSRTGLLLVCGQDRDGPLEMERASSYEVTPSRSGMGPGTADESFAGQQVRGSRISGQAAPGAFGRYPAARRSWR